MNGDEKIVLVGAGLAGSYLGILLAQMGYSVEILEKRPDMRREKGVEGRSINLAISARGLEALSKISGPHDLLDSSIPMRGREIHDLDGKKNYQPYSPDINQVINSVSRSHLNERLMTLAEATGKVKIRFDAAVESANVKEGTLLLNCSEKPISFDRVIGTDGTGSAVRSSILEHTEGSVMIEKLPYGYKELTIPELHGDFALNKNALHIWPRRHFMLIALPNPDKSFTATLFLPQTGEVSFASLQQHDEVSAFFKKYFSIIPELLPNLIEEYFQKPIGTLGTVRSEPWYYQQKALILGDAAHGIVPFYGQGMNCAFESCYLFADSLRSNNYDWEAAFKQFYKTRKPDTEAIADLAIRNFSEMQDHVADSEFLFKKSILRTLEDRYPKFKTEYSLVTFSTCSYALAKKEGERQVDLLNKIVANLKANEPYDWSWIDPMVQEYLAEDCLS